MISKEDLKHLKFIHDRLVNVHCENYNYDYIRKLRSIINSFQTESDILEEILERYPDEEFLKADGFDKAIIGVSEDFNQPLRLVYSTNKCIEILCMDMSELDAIEYFDYNVKGSYMGEKTPIWLNDDF
jgi:hypothetical protein